MSALINLDEHELEFPCDYPIKIIGHAEPSFKKNVLKIIHHHFKKKVSDDLISYKKSRNDKYLSITVQFMAESRHHVDAIYKDLKACSQVVFLI